MNHKQNKMLLIGSLVAFVVVFPIEVAVVKRNDRIRAQKAEERQHAHEQFMEKIDGVKTVLDKQLVTAKFWEQVTGE